MRLAVVSEWDCKTPAEWSGTPFFMARAAVNVLGASMVLTHPRFAQLCGTVEQRLRTIGAYVSARLEEEAIDLALFQGTSAVPFSEGSFQRIVWHDSTWFGLMSQKGVDFPQFCAWWPALQQWDERVLANADRVFFASQWARETASSCYGGDATRLGVLPYGANLLTIPSADEVRGAISARSRSECRLLFVGKDWRRKGLSRAIAVVEELNRRGVHATLTVVGVSESAAPRRSEFVAYAGILDKTSLEDDEEYAALLRESHFLIHPASFECFGIVVPEANAYGVPAITTPVGGLASTVENGVNGQTLPIADFAKRAAGLIADLVSDRTAYERAARSAYESFRSRHQWPTLAVELGEALRPLGWTPPDALRA